MRKPGGCHLTVEINLYVPLFFLPILFPAHRLCAAEAALTDLLLSDLRSNPQVTDEFLLVPNVQDKVTGAELCPLLSLVKER